MSLTLPCRQLAVSAALALALVFSASHATAAPVGLSDQLKWQLELPDGTISECDVGLTEAQEEAGVHTIQCSHTGLESVPGFYPAFSVNAHVLEDDGTVSDLIRVSNLPTVANGVQTNSFLALLTSDGDDGSALTPANGSIVLGPEFDDGQLHDITDLLGLQNAKIKIQFMSDGDAPVPEPASWMLVLLALTALARGRMSRSDQPHTAR